MHEMMLPMLGRLGDDHSAGRYGAISRRGPQVSRDLQVVESTLIAPLLVAIPHQQGPSATDPGRQVQPQRPP